MSKPEYTVPSMREVAELPWNGYNVASTFSGCGGSCLGYRMAGYRVRWANEFIPAAQEVYKANHPDSVLDTRDIREVTGESILDAIGLDVGELDLFDGSPPCSAFSSAGAGSDGWGKVKKYSDKAQRVDDLFFEYARLIRELQPKVFVAENTSGLVRGKARGYFKQIMRELTRCGYRVKARMLDSLWLGVPQRRKRLIFVGVRSDLNAMPAHPAPFKYWYTTRDVLPHLRQVKHGGKPDNWRSSETAHPTITQTIVSPTGYFSGGQYVTEDSVRNARLLEIDELRKVCSFPADFELGGTFEQQWERMGRAVPPLMMKQIGLAIQRKILDRL